MLSVKQKSLEDIDYQQNVLNINTTQSVIFISILLFSDIIHTVGPQKREENLLISCYKNCLDFMITNQIRTIAFPCIATGIYGYPIDKAVHVSNRQVREFLEKNKDHVDRIIFCLFGPDDVDIYQRALQAYFPIN